VAKHSFWIIVDGETPTSFRSPQREDLLPTLTQLQRKQPQVKLMWFDRGRLWESQEAAREALGASRERRGGRGRGWRPGGDHVDPRAKYDISRDEKRARFKAREMRDRQDGGPPRDRDDRPSDDGPKPEAPYKPGEDRPQGDRPQGDRPQGDRPFRPQGDRPFKPRGEWRGGGRRLLARQQHDTRHDPGRSGRQC